MDDLDDLLDPDDLANLDDVGESEVPKAVTHLLEEAARAGASAIHLEPTSDGALRVRLRVGTTLREGPVIPRGLERGVIVRLKVLGQMDVAERRVPQWGEFTSDVEAGQTVAWRVVTLPGDPEERITVHVTPVDAAPPQLDHIVGDEGLAEVRAALDQGRGLVLVAGPRWSGADRFLDACLLEAAQPDRAAVSIGQALRAAMPNVHQVVVHPDAGMDTPLALRAAVRSAVDVIQVHSLEDADAVVWAVNGALNGSLVLGSIPMADAEGAVLRLLETPIAHGLVAEALSLVIGVRHIRRLCPSCRRQAGDGGYTATGCDECGTTGYLGTVPVSHTVGMDRTIRQAVRSGEPEAVVTAIRTAAGTFREAALRAADAGEISMTDALRETPDPDR